MSKCRSCGHITRQEICPECGLTVREVRFDCKDSSFLCINFGITPLQKNRRTKTLNALIEIAAEENGEVVIFDGNLLLVFYGNTPRMDFDPVFSCYSGLKIRNAISSGKIPNISSTVQIRAIAASCSELARVTDDLVKILRNRELTVKLIAQSSVPGKIVVSEGLSSRLKGRFELDPAVDFVFRGNVHISMFVIRGKSDLSKNIHKCPFCGRAGISTYFCPGCGRRVASVSSDLFDELKQLTVLFAEFRNASGDDIFSGESYLEKIFSAFNLIIEEEEGVVIRFEKHSLRAVFGLEKSTDNDPLHACYAALKMHQTMQELKEKLRTRIPRGITLSIGLNSGKVGKGFIGNCFDIVGHTKELAVKLGRSAPAGETYLTLNFGRQLKGRFLLKPAGQISDGANVVQAFSLLGKEKIRQRKILGKYPDFVGRKAEMEFCIDKFTKSIEQSIPRMVLIHGVAGIGKTRLMQEFEQYWHQSEYTIMLTRSYLNQTVATNYHVFRVFLLQKIRKKTALDLLAYLKQLFPDRSDQELRKSAAAVSRLLGFENIDEDLENLASSPELLAQFVFKVFEEIMTKISEKTPILIFIEDFHFADEGSIRLIEHLLRWVRARLFFVATARPEWKERKLRFPETRFFNRQIQEMSQPQIREMVTNLLSGVSDIPEILFQKIADVSLGNPFYVEEMIVSLFNRGVIREIDGGYEIRQELIESHEVPDSLEMLVQVRLETLGRDALRMLKKASVIGRRFSIPMLVELDKGHSVQQMLELCLDKGILMKDLVISESGQYLRFSHDIFHAIIYGKLTGIQKNELHHRVAQYVEHQVHDITDSGQPGELYHQLCFHYERAKIPEKHLEYSVLAGTDAYKNFRNAEAVEYFSAAEKILRKQPGIMEEDRTVQYLEFYADSMNVAGENQKMVEIIDYFLQNCHFEAQNFSRLLLKKLNCYQMLTDIENWENLLISMENFLKTKKNVFRNSELIRVRLMESRGALEWQKGSYDEAQRNLENALELNRNSGDDSGVGRCFLGIGLCHHHRCEYGAAGEYYHNSLMIYEKLDDIPGRARALNSLGMLCSDQESFSEARNYYQQSLELHEKTGNLAGIANAYNNIGKNSIQTGHYDEGLIFFEKASEIYSEIGDELAVAYVLNNIGEVFHCKGDFERALEYYSESLQIKEEIGDVWACAYTLQFMGDACRELGDVDRAREFYQKSLRIRKRIGDRRGIAQTEKAFSELKI